MFLRTTYLASTSTLWPPDSNLQVTVRLLHCSHGRVPEHLIFCWRQRTHLSKGWSAVEDGLDPTETAYAFDTRGRLRVPWSAACMAANPHPDHVSSLSAVRFLRPLAWRAIPEQVENAFMAMHESGERQCHTVELGAAPQKVNDTGINLLLDKPALIGYG